MATAYWVGNAALQAQVITCTVTAVANAATLTATTNGKQITYICTASDTTSTAAAAFAALLQASLNPEFQEAEFIVSANVITATAVTPGMPMNIGGTGLTFTAAGGASVTQATATANSSPSDVDNANNWIRNGVYALPQDGDDLVLINSTVPLLWNLQALAGLRPNSLTRYGTHTGQVGLPYLNPAGYVEWRQIYFQFAGTNSGTLTILIGDGQGNGPALEQYDIQDTGQANSVTVLSGQDVRFNCNTVQTFAIKAMNAKVSIAIENGQATKVTSAIIDGGATITFGLGVTFSGVNLTINNATLNMFAASAPSSIVAVASTLNCYATGINYASLTATDGSTVSYLSNATITSLTLARNSTFDKSQDLRGMLITGGTMDGTCQINDPNNTITYTNPITISSQVQSGPFLIGGGRTIKVT